MKKKRISLSKIKLHSISNTPVTPPDSIEPNPAAGIELRFNAEHVTGFYPSVAAIVIDDNGKPHTEINGWPEKTISINIPESDMPRVKGWFSNDYQGITVPESDTLIKNLKNSISSLLNDYDYVARNHNLFRMPCKFAWCGIDSNGKRSRLHEIAVEHPNRNAPALPILTHYFVDNQLFTRVQIRNIASRLTYRIKEGDLTVLRDAGYEYIEIYATKEAEYRAAKSDYFSISSINIDSEPRRCWTYDRFSYDEIEISVNSDTDFRRLCILNLLDLNSSGEFTNLPISSALLANFSSADKYKTGSSEDISSDNINEELLSNSTDELRWTHFLSEPLDLGLPENDKHLHRTTLYGIFERKNPENICIKVFGSHHREQWHRIASANSYIIHGLRRCPYRWFRVEITLKLRPGDKLEAITFEFTTNA